MFAYRQTRWTHSLIWVHTVCKNDFENQKQMTKQTTIILIGSLNVQMAAPMLIVSKSLKKNTRKINNVFKVKDLHLLRKLMQNVSESVEN